jgi:hypothetical protein
MRKLSNNKTSRENRGIIKTIKIHASRFLMPRIIYLQRKIERELDSLKFQNSHTEKHHRVAMSGQNVDKQQP